MSDMATNFAHAAASYLRETYLPRLRRALEALPEEDLWWRPHEGVISFGNVLLHLEGNVRQWIVGGLGGASDHRERASELAATDGPSGGELIERLAATVGEACSVLDAMDAKALGRRYAIQGENPTGLEAILHVVEHFGWHTGQAVWIAKARAGEGHGVAFFDDGEINAAKNG